MRSRWGWMALCIWGWCSLSPHIAFAQAQGKSFSLTVADSLSGVWSAPLYCLDDGTLFIDVPDDYNFSGTYTEVFDEVTGTSTLNGVVSDAGGYVGIFSARTMQTVLMGTQPVTLITGVGIGNAGDLFFFFGVAIETVEPPPEDPPVEDPPARRTPRWRRE